MPFGAEIPTDISLGYSIAKNNEKITIIPLGAKPSVGVLVGENKVRYKNLWKDTDLELIITSSGIKEDIIINSKNAPKEFKFKIIKSNENIDSISFIPSYLIDNHKTFRDVKTSEKEGVFTVSYDNTGLSYPLILDPTTTVIPSYAFYVDSRYPTTMYAFPSAMKVGLVQGYQISYPLYSYLRFNLSESLRNVKINSAKLTLYAQYHMTDNSPSSTNLYVTPYKLTSTNTTPTTYNSRPTMDQTISGGKVTVFGGSRYYSFDITSIVKSTLPSSLYINIGLLGDGGFSVVDFATPWSPDSKLGPKLELIYNAMTTYTYTDNRLVQIEHADGKIEEFIYDKNGNLLRRAYKP
ncbi:hypothetical protein D3C81_1215060 [compost metagenome]